MHIGVVGINHKQAALQLREQFAQACARLYHNTHLLHHQLNFVLLSTCNRTELYFHNQNLGAAHSSILKLLYQELQEDFNQKLYSFFGPDCFTHLCRVMSGLDSAIVTETEIQGQAKKAYAQASQQQVLSKEMHFLFQKSLQVAKQIRQKLPSILNIEHAAYHLGCKHFQKPKEAKILFIGASKINKKLLWNFRQKGMKDLTLCNRNTETAYAIRKEHAVQVLHWNRKSEWSSYDWIILATKSPFHLISPKEFLSPSATLIMDLSVPRNACPFLSKHPLIQLFNIDKINACLSDRKQMMVEHILCAETRIKSAADKYITLFKERERKKKLYTSTLSPEFTKELVLSGSI